MKGDVKGAGMFESPASLLAVPGFHNAMHRDSCRAIRLASP